MKIGQQIKFIVINKKASSLYSLIADGQRRLTSLGRNTWMSLMGSNHNLQPRCNREGFNILSDDTSMGKARIGIIGNNENDCVSCDSRIGFGTGGKFNDASTCGNQDLTAIGYILVQWYSTSTEKLLFSGHPRVLPKCLLNRGRPLITVNYNCVEFVNNWHSTVHLCTVTKFLL